MVSFTVNFLNDFNIFSTEFMHSFAFWLYSSSGFPTPYQVLLSAIIHFFMIFLLLAFMYNKNKAPLLPLPFQIFSSFFHSSWNWSSNVSSYNFFTLFVPEVFSNISHMYSFAVSSLIHEVSSFWEILSFTWFQQRRWSVLLKHVLFASKMFFLHLYQMLLNWQALVSIIT